MRLGKDAKVELLKKVPLFSKLNKQGLQQVAQIADELDLPAGKEMATEGDRGREFFVLLNGEAEVTKQGSRINTMKKGDFFGEIALVTKMPRTATVTATSDVDVLVITERDFDSLLKKTPEIGRSIAEALAERVAPELPVEATGSASTSFRRTSTTSPRSSSSQIRFVTNRVTTGSSQTSTRNAQSWPWYESPNITNMRSAAPARNTTKIQVKNATPIAVRHGASRGRSSRLWNA
jgi:CRP/FNR family transcriptional regulator, cyclic AMP receptor protein